MTFVLAISLSLLWLFGPILVLVGAVHTRRWIARRRAEIADKAAGEVAHGDVIRLPVGATPDALRGERASHGGEVGRG